MINEIYNIVYLYIFIHSPNRCIKHLTTGIPTNLKILNATENNITYGKEGVPIKLTCTVENGIPAATLIWSKEGETVANGSNDILLYQFTPTRFDHMQSITCYAMSNLLTSSLLQTIFLDIQCKSTTTLFNENDNIIIFNETN